MAKKKKPVYNFFANMGLKIVSKPVSKTLNDEYKIKFKEIMPDPGEDVTRVFRVSIEPQKSPPFTYRMAFSGTAMATVRQERPLIADPLKDAWEEVQLRVRNGEHKDLRLVRGRDGWFELEK